jgi:hypothetical protein
MRSSSLVLPVSLALLTALLLAAPVTARPAHKQALIDLFGPALPRKLHDCRTCHLPDTPGADPTDKPHNPFGARLKAVRRELRKAGKPTDITARILAILDEDSDGDGAANGLELLSGHSPGDPRDKPTADELADARRALARWREQRRTNYAWRPFRPVVRPAVPRVPAAGRNPIDAFLAVEHERRGLTPRPEAPKHVLLRRVYLDLIGLPPTREELHAFLSDESANAYEKVVDRLLASPHYGERWGRHWMDVWRYADWAGYGSEVRDSQQHIWHWRDWITESLNADKGYDRMLVEMLAADELAPNDTNALRATGFLVRNWYKFNRNVWLDRTVEHTGKAFLGITLNCARCHDHFFDPFTQKEYYAFRALFEPHQVRMDRLPGSPDLNRNGLPRVYDANLTAPTFLFERGDEARPDKRTPIAPAVPASLGGALTIKSVALPKSAYLPDQRDFVKREALVTSRAAIDRARAEAVLARRNAAVAVGPLVAASPLTALPRAVAAQRGLELRALAELDVQIAEARHNALTAVLAVEAIEGAGRSGSPEWKQAAVKAQAAQRRAQVLDAARDVGAAKLAHALAAGKSKAATAQRLKVALARQASAEAEARKPASPTYARRNLKSYPTTSTGRRLALARWLTDRNNPLTARVAVNHIWLRHFGKGLVPTEFDFGRNGQTPTHPALLDWLAAELVDRDWRMKELHRLLVTSAAYRRASTPSARERAADPDNRYLWRMNSRRMEGEVVRDSLLAVAGQLDPTMGGPDIDHNLGLTVARRSLYFRHAAEKQMEFLLLFDAASVNECYRRTESIVPQQALALANSSLAIGQSRRLATALTRLAGPPGSGDAAFVRAGFEQVLGRAATAAEMTVCREFLVEQAAVLANPKRLTPFATGSAAQVPPAADPRQRAREGLIHVLLNHHEFVTIR